MRDGKGVSPPPERVSGISLVFILLEGQLNRRKALPRETMARLVVRVAAVVPKSRGCPAARLKAGNSNRPTSSMDLLTHKRRPDSQEAVPSGNFRARAC